MARQLFFPGSRSITYFDKSLPNDCMDMFTAWTDVHVDRDYSPNSAEWASALFALDTLLHRACHVASAVNILRQDSKSNRETEISDLLESLVFEHKNWAERLVVVKAKEIEKSGTHTRESESSSSRGDLRPLKIPPKIESSTTARQFTAFLDYPPLYICDSFFMRHLNTWRGVGLHVELILHPIWGKSEDGMVKEAVDVCRTYAALDGGNEFLGSEKAIALYLAGVIFGGPDIYLVFYFSISLTDSVERVHMGCRAAARVDRDQSPCVDINQKFRAYLEPKGQLLG